MLEATVDGVILLLLVVVLVAGLVLHKRLQRLRGGDGELAGLVESLNRAVARAEAVLGDLKRTALESGEVLDRDRASARALIDDLNMLCERAGREADRLADAIGAARPLGEAGRRVSSPAGPGRPAAPVDPEQLEQALRSLR